MGQGVTITSMLPALVTQRLLLVPASSADLGHMHGLLAHPEVRCFLCDDMIISDAQVRDMLREAAGLAPAGLGLWSLMLKGGDRVGLLGLQPVAGTAAQVWPDFSGEVEPLIALHPEAWGRGYAAEALGRVAAYAFDELGLSRLVALVDEPNERSRRLLEQLGFTSLGTCAGPRHLLRAYSLSQPKRRLDSAGMCR
jgi:ribosomal-protein-alanine N-acetyltransferase